MLSRFALHFRSHFNGRTPREVVRKAFEDEAEEDGGSHCCHDSEPVSTALFVADDQTPECVEDDGVESPPAAFFDVEGGAKGCDDEDEETDGIPEEWGGFSISELWRGECGKDESRHDGDVGVGDVLGGHQGVEEDGTPAPYHEEEVEGVLFFPAFHHFIERVSCPGNKGKGKDEKIVVDMVILGVLGRGGPEDVVKAEEFTYKVSAVDEVHAHIPGKGDCEECKDALPGEEGEYLLRFFHGKAPEEKKGAGKDKAYRTFGEAGKAGSGVGDDEMFPASFHDADVAGKHGGNGEEKEEGISDDGMRDGPEFKRKSHHGTRPYSDDIILLDAPDIPNEKGDGEGSSQHGRKAGGEIRKSQDGVGNRKHPVDHDRFVIPEIAVNLRGHPVAGLYHFFGRKGIVGFYRVGDRKEPGAPEKEDKGGNEEESQCLSCGSILFLFLCLYSVFSFSCFFTQWLSLFF